MAYTMFTYDMNPEKFSLNYDIPTKNGYKDDNVVFHRLLNKNTYQNYEYYYCADNGSTESNTMHELYAEFRNQQLFWRFVGR